MTYLALVKGGRFAKMTLVEITVPNEGIMSRLNALNAWKEANPGLVHFELVEG